MFLRLFEMPKYLKMLDICVQLNNEGADTITSPINNLEHLKLGQ